MRYLAIALNLLLLGFVLWWDVLNVPASDEGHFTPLGLVLVLGTQSLVFGLAVLPTLVALLAERPRLEAWAIGANLAEWIALVVLLAYATVRLILKIDEPYVSRILAVLAMGLLVPATSSTIALRQRRAARSARIAQAASSA